MTQQQETRSPNSKWIWPFELVEQIGEGGMGVVYKARYVVNGRFVALKMVPTEVNDPTTLARFEREVGILKTLKHPNIVRCFGGVCEDKRRFYAMELVEGGTLEDKLQAKGKLPWEQVIHYALQICAGLQCLHEKGVVHRDIKPSNFLLTPQGQVRLSDFGLASVATQRKITAAGKTAGTFLYMAPEQIRGTAVTSRTDLYALGCVLYELLAGVPPFIGETPAATLHLHCNAPTPRITESVLDCPIALERVLDKLLQKDPQERYESAADVVRDLKGVSQTVSAAGRDLVKSAYMLGDSGPQRQVRSSTEAASTKGGNSTRWWPALLVSAVLLLILGGANLSMWRELAVGKRWENLWIKAAISSDPDLRLQAYYALQNMADASAAATKQLGAGLSDPDPIIRTVAAQGLAKSGSQGRVFLPDLIRISRKESDTAVRSEYEQAIRTLQEAGDAGWSPGIAWPVFVILGVFGGYIVFLWKKRSTGNTEPAETRELVATRLPAPRPY